MEFRVNRSARRLLPGSIAFLFHLSVLALALLISKLVQRERIVRIQPDTIIRLEAGGPHSAKLLLPPMLTAASSQRVSPHSELNSDPLSHAPRKRTPAKSSGGARVSPDAGGGTGDAMAGMGDSDKDVELPFAVFYPRPPVTDRSLLPPTERKIVVNVKLDAQGAVIGERLVEGLGNQLDKIVLETVKTWRFHPETVNGNPVPSEADLFFPFNPSYPITDSQS
jgi:TonB family protein